MLTGGQGWAGRAGPGPAAAAPATPPLPDHGIHGRRAHGQSADAARFSPITFACHLALAPPRRRFGPTLEAVDLSWGGSRISDAAAAALARCPRLHSVGLAGTAVSTEGVRQLLVAADGHAAAAAAAAGGGQGAREPFRVDVGSCRGLERGVRQAAALGMPQLRGALGMPPAA